MDTEINRNCIMGHISGLNDNSKNELIAIFNKSILSKYINIIDVDVITSKIIEDKNMEKLFAKFELYSEKSKDKTISRTDNKNALIKSKLLEKKMVQYWKVRMEYYINKLASNNKKVLLLGYLSFFNNHKNYLNLNISQKFFVKLDPIDHAKSIVKHHLDFSKDDIINGNFDLNYLDINFLVKKRAQLQTIYSKIGYIVMSLQSIINTLELCFQTAVPEKLYYASFIKYDKKIPVLTSMTYGYTQEWLALSSILLSLDDVNQINKTTNNINKGIKDNKPFIKLSKEQFNLMSKNGYIYEICSTDNFLPYPSKNNIYKYFTIKPIKFNRVLEINNIITQLKQLGIFIDII